MNTAVPTIRVLTVDDHPLLREGIGAVVGRQADMAIVGEAANGVEAVQQWRQLQPDVVLMDLQMPDMDGLQALASIRAEGPQARIIVLTTYKGDALAWRALKAGAVGYLLKSSLRTDLLQAIRAVHAGGRWVPADVAIELAGHAAEEPLTEREIEVLQRIAVGHSNREVGDQLSVSEDTIKARMKSILAKLQARDRTHAVSIALKRGIIRV
ncbi:response regulator transcription factor [uncultured Aquincola sp.]|uniref:response regulator transcription factor n=1 Tax=uncultured Aquincola sp. TaxID=886556 RepID=UPI0032B0FB82